MRAAYDAGVRFLVTDTSKPGMDNPTPQAGIFNPLEPRILMVPRRPVNLFYNVTTPTEWANEYNFLYHNYWDGISPMTKSSQGIGRPAPVPAPGRDRSLDVPSVQPARL